MEQKLTLDSPLRYLKGVGPERHKTLSRLGLFSLNDVFYFFPRRHEDRTDVKKVSEAGPGEKQCVRGSVLGRGLMRTRYGQSIFKVVLSDGKATLSVLWFNQPYLQKVFSPKTEVTFCGKVDGSGTRLKMVHPEYEIHAPAGASAVHSGRIVPIYPLTEDLSQKGLRQLLFQVLRHLMTLLHDPLPYSYRKKLGLKDLAFAMNQIHFPDRWEDHAAAYRRLVFDEFFMMQVLVQMKKAELQKENKELVHSAGEDTVGRFVESLDFALTAGQRRAIDDVIADMKKTQPMNRLVQGDVGSGKTAVSAAALVFTVANGFQGALMAPTEVLAQQHYFNLTRLLEPLGIRCGYLAQNLSKTDKDQVLAGVASGAIPLLIGTHALIQKDLRFKNLGLAVVDEQHKFGVFQRASLKEKSQRPPHFLLLTATPIPRTLALTLYGDLDISTIHEMPHGRKPVKTCWVGENKRQEVYALLDALLAKGRQGYVICPLIDAKEFSAKSVTAAHGELAVIFAHRKVGILHGRMKSAEKKKVMQDFKNKKIELLVSTVVLEVGVDVPNATLMIIENAEKFGLAQLHQLRGRVGRGQEESFCVLFSSHAGEDTAERLAAFEATESGFDIAEKDLTLRGAGDVAGHRQHGMAELRIGDIAKDIDLLMQARAEAAALVAKDPRLVLPEHRHLKSALQKRFGLSDAKKLTALA